MRVVLAILAVAGAIRFGLHGQDICIHKWEIRQVDTQFGFEYPTTTTFLACNTPGGLIAQLNGLKTIGCTDLISGLVVYDIMEGNYPWKSDFWKVGTFERKKSSTPQLAIWGSGFRHIWVIILKQMHKLSIISKKKGGWSFRNYP